MEARLWQTVRDGLMNDRVFLERIENRISQGTPDVHYVVDGYSGWIELKAMDRFRAGLGLTNHQRIWLDRYRKRGGRSWVLARVGEVFILVPAGYMLESKAWSLDQWLATAGETWTGRIDFEELRHALRG